MNREEISFIESPPPQSTADFQKAAEKIQQAIDEKSSKLDLSNEKLGPKEFLSLVPEIERIESLSDLDLTNLGLGAVPERILNLPNLKQLRLSGNLLTDLPTEFGSPLTLLDISDNLFESIPPAVLNMTSLEYLFANKNKLSSVPSDICKLTELEGLALDSNQLRSLPPSLKAMPKLAILGLNKNLFPPEVKDEITLHLSERQDNPYCHGFTAAQKKDEDSAMAQLFQGIKITNIGDGDGDGKSRPAVDKEHHTTSRAQEKFTIPTNNSNRVSSRVPERDLPKPSGNTRKGAKRARYS